MSIESYFDGILDEWYKYTDHNEYKKEDMKTVIRQFNESLLYGDIAEDRANDLMAKFTEVRKEVYGVE